MNLVVRTANGDDHHVISQVLREAAAWLEAQGMPMWRDNELLPEHIASDVADGTFVVGECASETVAVMKLQLEDPLFWPDLPAGEAAFVHRLAVRRAFAGRGVSTAMLRWAVARTRQLGRRYVRLDCEAARPRLRAVYEGFGFRHHSDRQVGPYLVARYEYPL